MTNKYSMFVDDKRINHLNNSPCDDVHLKMLIDIDAGYLKRVACFPFSEANSTKEGRIV